MVLMNAVLETFLYPSNQSVQEKMYMSQEGVRHIIPEDEPLHYDLLLFLNFMSRLSLFNNNVIICVC